MRIFYKLTSLYKRVRFLAWFLGTIPTVATPLIGYGLYALEINEERQHALTDSPEFASDIQQENLWDWLTGFAGSHGQIIGITLLFGVLFIALLIALQCFSFVAARTELSGVDKQEVQQEHSRRKAETDYDRFDDYGVR